MSRLSLGGALVALLLPLTSCNLLDVTNSEDPTTGRGARVFDPYQASNSGAIRLSLQMFNGCAVLPSGQMVAKNSATPTYPDTCPTLLAPQNPLTTMSPPTGKLTLVAGTTYFLNQFTFTDMVLDQHTGAGGHVEAMRWAKTQSRLRKLDWSNLGKMHEDWFYVGPIQGVFQESWTREILFGNAAWQQVKDDTFTIEVLDADGNVRGTPVSYLRSELLAESAQAGHSRIAWRVENLLAPRYPGDTEPRGVPARPGALPQPISYRSFVRMDLVGSTNPFKSFRIGDLSGDGALRVTWSQLPDDPFYFPVTFISSQDLPPTCQDDAGEPRACGFGLDPRMELVAPGNGQYYEPGETLNMRLDLRDEDGNRLHSVDELPSAAEIVGDRANGIIALIPNYFFNTEEADSTPAIAVAGPLHRMNVQSNPLLPSEFVMRDYPWALVDDAATLRLIPGMFTARTSTHHTYKLPLDAKPGTYVVFAKANRYFMGERISRLKPYFFQVGQSQPTTYPGKVGNCQICHRGVLSLDNLRHGLSVDHVEGCKGCHSYNSDLLGRVQDEVHRILMRSPRYNMDKQDCRVCHLDRSSAIRPSYAACASCHPTVHGGEYFEVQFSPSNTGLRFGNCAQSCHGEGHVPTRHYLPEN